ncbi:PAS domain-containing protein, partial [Klenkia sp. PcliD-1-E]|uniref:PAS domain-containing protein n=1 Tax=Klenkia sp. PcliD-1-E TaxID=2954492 RepID=UPI0020971A7E
ERAAPAAATAPRLPELPALAPAAGEGLLHRALAATTSGVVIVDMQLPDQPMVYVNRAFEELSGYPREEVLGRNCRFLQTADTDLAAVARIREGLDAGRECRETLLNHRGPDRTPWWNELHLAPVTDAAGRVVQYIGVQNDVTARVEAQQRLAREQERTIRFGLLPPATPVAGGSQTPGCGLAATLPVLLADTVERWLPNAMWPITCFPVAGSGLTIWRRPSC